MSQTLAAQFVVTTSIFKPVVFLAVLIVWGRWASILDKDADFFNLKRRWWNLGHLGAAILAFLLLLVIPLFWIGLPLGLIILASISVGYAIYRNNKVPENDRWTLSIEFFREAFIERAREKAMRESTLRFLVVNTTSRQPKPVPLRDEPNYEPHVQFEDLLEAALAQHAERVELAGADSDVAVQFVIDGVSYRQPPMPGPEGLRMIDYLKAEAGLDVQDRRRKQSGTVKVDTGPNGLHTLRVMTAGSTRGTVCTIEIDREQQLEIAFDKLGLLDSQRQQLQPVLDEARGIVLIGSPPRQGRTTTLYSVIAHHDPYMLDIHTIEENVEHEIEGVTHHEVGEAGLAKTLQSRLLREPDILMLGNLGDKETAKVAAKAGREDKRLYAGLQANDTMQALQVWMKAVEDQDLAAESLAAILCQRLIRKLCPTCRQAFRPDPKALKRLNLPADRIQQLFKESGKVMVKNKPEPCPTCNGIGYQGRTAVFEVMVLDAQAKDFIRSGDLGQLRSYLRKKKMLWLQEAAVSKVVSGVTSIGEIMRAMGKQQGGEKSAAQPAQADEQPQSQQQPDSQQSGESA